MVLVLRQAEGGWYAVTSPLDPQLNTQARTIEEAFFMAYDAQKCLKESRAKLARERSAPKTKRAVKLRASSPR
jgi:hypothetical protein